MVGIGAASKEEIPDCKRTRRSISIRIGGARNWSLGAGRDYCIASRCPMRNSPTPSKGYVAQGIDGWRRVAESFRLQRYLRWRARRSETFQGRGIQCTSTFTLRLHLRRWGPTEGPKAPAGVATKSNARETATCRDGAHPSGEIRPAGRSRN